jgi:hypothetical protein
MGSLPCLMFGRLCYAEQEQRVADVTRGNAGNGW